MREDVADDLCVFDEADNPHVSLTFRADQGINFINLLNQPCPILSEYFYIAIRFKDTGDNIIYTQIFEE